MDIDDNCCLCDENVNRLNYSEVVTHFNYCEEYRTRELMGKENSILKQFGKEPLTAH